MSRLRHTLRIVRPYHRALFQQWRQDGKRRCVAHVIRLRFEGETQHANRATGFGATERLANLLDHARLLRGIDFNHRLHDAARDTVLLASDGLFDNLRLDEIVQTIRKIAPGYMPMGSRGMGEMGAMEMELPPNTLPMMTGFAQFGPVEMGGMFSVVKVRAGLGSGDYKDPGWYKHPEGSVAYEYKGAGVPEAKNAKGQHSGLKGQTWRVRDPRKPKARNSATGHKH